MHNLRILRITGQYPLLWRNKLSFLDLVCETFCSQNMLNFMPIVHQLCQVMYLSLYLNEAVLAIQWLTYQCEHCICKMLKNDIFVNWWTFFFRIILSFLGVLMMFGTLYDVVAIQMNRSSNDKHEPQQVTAISTKPGIQNGGFAPDPEISKATLPDDDKICTGVAKRYGATEVAVEDVKRNVVSPARTTAEEKSRGTWIASQGKLSSLFSTRLDS